MRLNWATSFVMALCLIGTVLGAGVWASDEVGGAIEQYNGLVRQSTAVVGQWSDLIALIASSLESDMSAAEIRRIIPDYRRHLGLFVEEGLGWTDLATIYSNTIGPHGWIEDAFNIISSALSDTALMSFYAPVAYDASEEPSDAQAIQLYDYLVFGTMLVITPVENHLHDVPGYFSPLLVDGLPASEALGDSLEVFKLNAQRLNAVQPRALGHLKRSSMYIHALNTHGIHPDRTSHPDFFVEVARRDTQQSIYMGCQRLGHSQMQSIREFLRILVFYEANHPELVTAIPLSLTHPRSERGVVEGGPLSSDAMPSAESVADDTDNIADVWEADSPGFVPDLGHVIRLNGPVGGPLPPTPGWDHEGTGTDSNPGFDLDGPNSLVMSPPVQTGGPRHGRLARLKQQTAMARLSAPKRLPKIPPKLLSGQLVHYAKDRRHTAPLKPSHVLRGRGMRLRATR